MSQKTSYEDARRIPALHHWKYRHRDPGRKGRLLHRKRRDQLSDPVHSRRSCGGYHRSRRCTRGSHHRLPDQRPLPAGFHCICQPGIPDRGLCQGLFPSAGAPSAAPSPQKRPLGCRMALGQIKLLPDIRILYRPFLKFLHHSVQSLPFCGKVCKAQPVAFYQLSAIHPDAVHIGSVCPSIRWPNRDHRPGTC